MSEGQEYRPVSETLPPYPPPSPPRLRHSGLGIASFVWGLINGVLMFLVFAGAGIVEMTKQPGGPEPKVAYLVVGFLLFGGLGACVLATVLGIAGLFQRDRSKLFPVLGLIINLMVLLGTGFLVLIGALTTA